MAAKKRAAAVKPKRTSRRASTGRPDRDALFAAKTAKKIPHDFVLDELASLSPSTRPMFGCTAIYVGDAIVMVLRGRGDDDDGVWLATTRDHHASLREELPSMRSIRVFGTGESGWQVVPETSIGFEDEVLRACAMVRARDPRIGKVPKPRKPRRPR